jgi:osmoprotectant transport system ATP-binding protein
MIELHKVSKRFETVVALQPTDLCVEKHRTTVLIGPSGCGKSTILRLIAGLLQPTEGSIDVDGVPVNRLNLLEFRRRLGYVIQDGGLFPHLTARDNVLLASKEMRIPPNKAIPRLHELCVLTRLPEDVLARYPVELSGGQRQRVSLIRALMLEPRLLLLDEPLGALDPIVRSSLRDDLKAIFQRMKSTVVLVTHDLAEAAHFGDLIVLLKDGRVIQQGTLADLVHRPTDGYVAEFIRAQSNLVLP